LDDAPDLVLPREDVPPREPRFEEALRDDVLLEDLPRDELPRVEALLLLRDSPDWLPLDLFLLELPEDELRDRLLPDFRPEDEDRVLREEDDLVPDDLDELLRALLLDLCAMQFSLLLCAMRMLAPQDARRKTTIRLRREMTLRCRNHVDEPFVFVLHRVLCG
jgi:hypothetical protein